MITYLKTYKTHDNEAVITLYLGNVPVKCHFKNGNIRIGEWAKLTTANMIVQKAIEESELFGNKIFLDGKPIPIDEEKESFGPESITNVAQLRDYLVSKYNCDRTKIASPNALKAKVSELGLELPNMTW